MWSGVSPATIMKAFLCLSFLTTVFGFQFGWSSFLDDDLDMWNLDRRSSCVGQSGKCLASDQCCTGFVCAAFDDLFGKNPEVPGYCVREKDLTQCESTADCKPGSKCAPLGRRMSLYCIHEDDLYKNYKDDENSFRNKGGKGGSKAGKGNLASLCETDDDCKPYANDGKDRMCCQEVRRYRQKPRRQCDRITSVSICITKRK